MVNLAYHCSPVGNIEKFEPKVSSHGKEFVYATPYKTIAYVFGIEGHNDFIVHPVVDKDGNMAIIEMCPDALDKYYKNKEAYLYTMNADDFKVRTQWQGEVCSDEPVRPLNVVHIPDLKQAIMQEQKNGNLEVISFDNRNKIENMDEVFAARSLCGILNGSERVQHNIVARRKGLENKEIFKNMKLYVSEYIKNLSDEKVEPIDSFSCIVPKSRREKFMQESDDEAVKELMVNMFYAPLAKAPQFAQEIKQLNNPNLIEKVMQRLQKIQQLLSVEQTNNMIFQKNNNCR